MNRSSSVVANGVRSQNRTRGFARAVLALSAVAALAFAVGCGDDDDEQCVDQQVAVPSAEFCNSTYVQITTNLKNPTSEFTFRDGMCHVRTCGERP